MPPKLYNIAKWRYSNITYTYIYALSVLGLQFLGIKILYIILLLT